MPANENVWHNLRLLHIVFAVSCFLMLATTFWMMQADFDDEWRPIQKVGDDLRAQQIKEKEHALKTQAFEADQAKLQAAMAAADAEAATKSGEISRLEHELAPLESQMALDTGTVRSSRAERDKSRADFDLKIRDGAPAAVLKAYQADFDRRQKIVDDRELALQQLQARIDSIRRELGALTKAGDAAAAALKKHSTDLDRLNAALRNIEPDDHTWWGWAKSLKRASMELPIIEGFNGPLKIGQLWLPDLTINFGGMRDVARFDRCITCHINIERVEAGNAPAFPHDPHGLTVANAPAQVAERNAALKAGASLPPATYAHPYSTHPNPDLYLTASSPHPMQKFGCTICHEGQGSGTSFQNASHTPNTPERGEAWHREHGWSFNHFWEYPMYPDRLKESSCLKCHHGVVELGLNPKHGNSAPSLYKGYELVQKFGCFGCHEINGYNAGKPIGPDMRLEPPTEEEAARIAADPGAIAGDQRKVGPGLRHFAAKTTKPWAAYWVEKPSRFHPETRMPQFFGLTNQKDAEAQKYQPVEIAGVVEYLMSKSEPLKTDHWAEGYTPDPERGQRLFSQRGCLACHKHEDFPGASPDFGPDLSHVHAKIKGGEEGLAWVYTWIREPTRHSARTRMPNLFLEPEGEGDKRVDPAADIAAYLLKKGPADYPDPAYDPKALDELVDLFLVKVLTADQRKEMAETRQFPKKPAEIKGDEIELTGGPITDQMKLAYVGRRTISRYGCYGCHDIVGYEKARPIGTGLQDWGRKDGGKLALEHIEEYLHHHGEADGSITAKRVERAMTLARANAFETPEEKDVETSVAFFVDQLNSHGRAGFLWQKLRDPRSYDYKKISTKGYDERLRMPKFPFNEKQIEAVATFVLGLVAEPPAEKYLYRPQGAAKSRIEGEKLLTKYNCVGCHVVELPEIRYRANKTDELTATELQPAEYPEGLKLLLQLKPPRNGKTSAKLVSGEPLISFHGTTYQLPDPQDDPADREYSFDLWETLEVDQKVLLPGTRMLVPENKLEKIIPARGGNFAEWLVDSLMKANPDNNRFLAWQMSPPPLYLEGMKVQTPWLYSFLRNPYRIRYTTVLRMPKFNMSHEEAQRLADYFSAADGSRYPYLDIPQRDPDYLHAQDEKIKGNYNRETWKLLNAPLCIKCHSVGGREFQGSDPKKDIRGPNLDAVADRLRPDWTMLWLYKPQWVTPYTSMPQPFPKNQKQFEEILQGDGLLQTTGARDALMNYHRLLETEGKLAGDAAAAGAKRQPGEGGN